MAIRSFTDEHCHHIPTRNRANEVVCKVCGLVLNEDRIGFRLSHNLVGYSKDENFALPEPIFLNVFTDANEYNRVIVALGKFHFLCGVIGVTKRVRRQSQRLYQKIILSIDDYRTSILNFHLALLLFSLREVRQLYRKPLSLRRLMALVAENRWALSLPRYKKIIREYVPRKFRTFPLKAEDHIPILINLIFEYADESKKMLIQRTVMKILSHIPISARGGKSPELLAVSAIYVTVQQICGYEFRKKYNQTFISNVTDVPIPSLRIIKEFVKSYFNSNNQVGELGMGRRATPEGWTCPQCEQPKKVYGKINDVDVCKKCFKTHQKTVDAEEDLKKKARPNNGFEFPIKEIRELQTKLLNLIENDISNLRIKDYAILMRELRQLTEIGIAVKEKIIIEIEKV